MCLFVMFCDVYSFGMLLFEIIGRRRNLDIKRAESQEWFPIWVWKRFDTAQLGELIIVCGIEEKSKEIAERMIKIALWCVQYRQELRPIMSVVVKIRRNLALIISTSCNSSNSLRMIQNREIKNRRSLTNKFHTTHRDKTKLLAYRTMISFRQANFFSLCCDSYSTT